MALIDEIHEQPAVLQRWLETQMESVGEIAEAIRQRDVDYVFLAARGSSDHAGVYAQYLLGSRNRLPVALAAPSLFTMYDESPSAAQRPRHRRLAVGSVAGHRKRDSRGEAAGGAHAGSHQRPRCSYRRGR